MNPSIGSQRIVPLETLRGIAALIVFLAHFVLAFLPQRHGLLPGAIVGGNLMETPVFLLFNGSAAVTFFFVLSGFVLSVAFLRDGDHGRLSRGAIKRWPRLALLSVLSTLISWLLFVSGAYRFGEAAMLSQSEWLKQFAFAGLADGFQADFGEAFLQGVFRVFFFGEASYNTSLWTMQIEFVGSFLSFGLAAILFRMRTMAAVAFLLLAFALTHFKNLNFNAFVIGVALAYAWIQRGGNRMPVVAKGAWERLIKALLLVACLYALGFLNPGKGVYQWLNWGNPANEAVTRIYLHAFASAGLIWLVLHSAAAMRVLGSRVGRRLGQWSFPIYVLQVPLVCSLSSALYMAWLPQLGLPATLALDFAVSLIVLLAASEVLGRIDRRWCEWLGRLSRRLANDKEPPDRDGAPAPGLQPMSGTGATRTDQR